MARLSKAAQEKIASRAIRMSRTEARDYHSLSMNAHHYDRATAGHLFNNARAFCEVADTLKERFF
ncbi:MAG: hypothetical protein ACKO0Z_06920 [Betaproteobacteria bacterium]